MKKYAPRTSYIWHYSSKAGSKELTEAQLRANCDNILSLLAYDGCTFEDVRSASTSVFPAVPSAAWLIDHICEAHIRPFVSIFEKQVLQQINKVVSTPEGREPGVAFRPFNRNIPTYSHVVDVVYQQYRHLEHVSLQVEKLIRHYLDVTRQSEEVLQGMPQRQLFLAWQFNSDLFALLISNLHHYFQRNHVLPAFSSIEETISKVAQIHFALDQSEFASCELQDSLTPTHTSVHMRCEQAVKQDTSLHEQRKPRVDEDAVPGKKKRNKRKNKEKKKASEKIERLFEPDLKYLPVRELAVVRPRPVVVFTGEEREQIAAHLALT